MTADTSGSDPAKLKPIKNQKAGAVLKNDPSEALAETKQKSSQASTLAAHETSGSNAGSSVSSGKSAAGSNAGTGAGATESESSSVIASSPEAAALANRKPLKSNQLDRTLAELENAFAAWDSITEDSPNAADLAKKKAGHEKSAQKAAPVTEGEQDFRTKTRKLLTQLREQIVDLSED